MTKHMVFRVLVIALAIVALAAAGSAYGVFAGVLDKSVAWGHWSALLLLVCLPLMVWRMTLGADLRVPQLTLPTVAPLWTGPRGLRTRLRDLPGILRGAAIPLLIVALARPQHLESKPAEESGIDIVICLDLSGSMSAIFDAPAPPGQRKTGPRPTRVETAKDVLVDFIRRRKTDRIGVVAFARNAYWLSPPTLDYDLLAELVRSMQLGVSIDQNGTAIGDAVGTAVARLRNSDAKSKVIILITDGDNRGGIATPEWAMDQAKERGFPVYTVQIGNGDEVDVETGRDVFNQPIYDRQIIPVDPVLLRKIAETTGGESYVATDRKGLEQSMHKILDRLEKSSTLAPYTRTEELFPFFLIPGVALVLLEAITRLFLVRRFP
jgi:Ca-activated chloride channel family protein